MFVETYILRLQAGFLEYGTLSTLADKLYTSQPAVSRAFKKLEDEIGTPLFERKKISDAIFIKHDSAKGISKFIEQSSLLTFVSDHQFGYDIPNDRKIVPLADREMNVEFFKVTLTSTP